MAFISSAFTAGQTLTAASMEDLRGNANAGHSVFTNEAARDAAITAPTEGLMAYLTAPTVPAATGGSTAVPSGVVTIYNGSAWVCVTPVAANTITSGTTTSGGYTTTLTSGGTNPSVTLSTGTTALISYSVLTSNSSATTVQDYVAVSVSGATTISAGGIELGLIACNSALGLQTLSTTLVFTGLTAGTNTFTMNYAVTGGTGTYSYRRLTVQGVA